MAKTLQATVYVIQKDLMKVKKRVYLKIRDKFYYTGIKIPNAVHNGISWPYNSHMTLVEDRNPTAPTRSQRYYNHEPDLIRFGQQVVESEVIASTRQEVSLTKKDFVFVDQRFTLTLPTRQELTPKEAELTVNAIDKVLKAQEASLAYWTANPRSINANIAYTEQLKGSIEILGSAMEKVRQWQHSL